MKFTILILSLFLSLSANAQKTGLSGQLDVLEKNILSSFSQGKNAHFNPDKNAFGLKGHMPDSTTSCYVEFAATPDYPLHLRIMTYDGADKSIASSSVTLIAVPDGDLKNVKEISFNEKSASIVTTFGTAGIKLTTITTDGDSVKFEMKEKFYHVPYSTSSCVVNP